MDLDLRGLLLLSTSLWVSCDLPRMKAGISSLAPWSPISSPTLKSRSANTTCLSQILIWNSTSPTCTTSWSDCYPKLYSVMLLIIKISLWSCLVTFWNIHKNFQTINNAPTWWIHLLKCKWHVMLTNFTWWPRNDKS